MEVNFVKIGDSNEKNIIPAVYNAKIGELEFVIVSYAMARLEPNILMKHLENILTRQPFCLERKIFI